MPGHCHLYRPSTALDETVVHCSSNAGAMNTTRPSSVRSYTRCRNNTFSSSRSNYRNGIPSDDSLDSLDTALSSLPNSATSSIKSAYRCSSPKPIIIDVKPSYAIKLHESDEVWKRERQRYSDRYSDRMPDKSVHDEDLYHEPEQYEDGTDFIFNDSMSLQDYSFASVSRATVPSEFAEYFPSHRKLLIHHDDSTDDGNMNLRLDVEEIQDDVRVQVQLFHLRMKDLASRTFSLRRYCRDSGREVCNYSRRSDAPATMGSELRRSLKHALTALVPDTKSMHPSKSNRSSAVSTRIDSDSDMDDDMSDVETANSITTSNTSYGNVHLPPKCIKLEFSNYAQVNVKRSGNKASRHYAFEYWGTKYSWKSSLQNAHSRTNVRFDLMKTGQNKAIAHIVPVQLTIKQLAAEDRVRGWIAPCEMWISDSASLTAFTDVAE